MLRLIIFVGVCLFLFGGGWVWWRDGIAAADPTDANPVLFVVNKGEGIRSVAARLAQENLIRSPTSFYILVKFLGIEKQVQAGDFRLNKTMDAETIARELTHGILDVWVTTLEGWRVEEVATRLAKDLDIPEQEFLKHAREGYMFPDTYLIPRDASPAAVARILLANFDKKVTPTLRRDALKSGLSFQEVLTMASVVEREGRTDEDRPVIAGILLKRLKADWPLEADATLQYALGYDPLGKTWWRKNITSDDKRVRSPYNTYLNPGLPQAPIANPGLAAIKSVIYPTQSPYWYYLHDPKGTVHYAKTLEEHNANIAKYLL